MVIIFDRAVDCDSPAAFLVLRAFRWIANDANAAGGEAVNAKPVINPDTKIFNGETVEGAIALGVAVVGLCSARGSPVLCGIGVGPLPGLRRIDRGPPRVRWLAGNGNGPVRPDHGLLELPGLRLHAKLATAQGVTTRILCRR